MKHNFVVVRVSKRNIWITSLPTIKTEDGRLPGKLEGTEQEHIRTSKQVYANEDVATIHKTTRYHKWDGNPTSYGSEP